MEAFFLSIPTVLDPSLAPEGRHILHIFTTSSMGDKKGSSLSEQFPTIMTFLISNSLLYEEGKKINGRFQVQLQFYFLKMLKLFIFCLTRTVTSPGALSKGVRGEKGACG